MSLVVFYGFGLLYLDKLIAHAQIFFGVWHNVEVDFIATYLLDMLI